jgi:putative DNA primase/helicase
MSLQVNASRDQALINVARGWHSFPLLPGKKTPGEGHGFKDAAGEPEAIKALFRSGAANLGIATGASQIAVLDVDTKPWEGKTGDASLAALVAVHGPLPETYTVRTWSGGLQYYFADPDGEVPASQGALGKDLDTRGTTGYVVAPPSVVKEIGKDHQFRQGQYEVILDVPLAPVPRWIVEALKPKERAPQPEGPVAADTEVEARIRQLSDRLAAIPYGEPGEKPVNDAAFAAGQSVGAGQISYDDAVRILLDGIAGWSWNKAGDYEKMITKIERGVRDGSAKPYTWVSRPDFIEEVVMPADDLPEIGHGQFRMSQRMRRTYGDDLRYSSALGWHAWDGVRWKPDEDGAVVRAAHEVIEEAWRDVPNQKDSDARKALVSDIGKVESATGLEGMLAHLRAMTPVAVGRDPFDKQADLFNTPSATIDLAKGEVREHRRSDLSSKVSGTSMTEVSEEDTKVFDEFLTEILPDAEVRAFVQRLFGQAMLGRVTEHIMPIFTGTGANGKGTLRDAVAHAFGDYAIDVDPEILMEQKFGRHGTFLLELLGRRVVFCSETERGRKFAEATMKRLVGGDPIQGNRMHKDPITFLPSHTLILLTNELPKVSGDDPAVWRRILVVPFDVVIPPERRDGNLPDRLKAAAPAVLAWVYQGWLDYQQQGLNPPEAVQARTAQYQAESDAVGRFLADGTQANANAAEPASKMYEAYSAWCRAEGEPQESIQDFGKAMAKHGVEKKRSKHGMVYRGRMILSFDDEEQEDSPF